MEIPATDDPAAAGRDRVDVGDATTREDEWIVGRRVELDVEDAPEIVERVADGAVDLGDAPERIRILDLVGVAVMAPLEATIAQEVAQLGGDRDLAGVRPGQLVRGRERNVRAEQGLDTERGGHAGRLHEAVGIGQEQRPDRASSSASR